MCVCIITIIFLSRFLENKILKNKNKKKTKQLFRAEFS